MTLNASTPIEQVAAMVSAELSAAGITAVLSGGAAVQIYTRGLYVSRDLDFVSAAGAREIEAALKKLGFSRTEGRHFVHPCCPYTLEFPPWPVAIGRAVIHDWGTRAVGPMTIQILTPTQCVMDRLAAFYHRQDRQALDQAVAVASSQDVDLDVVRRWSNAEGHGERFEEFLRAIRRSSRG